MVNLLLYNLTHGYNIGQIIRSAYITGISTVYIFDSSNIVKIEEKEIEYHSTGLSKSKPEFTKMVEDIEKFLKNYNGRVISTEIKKNAVSLCKFEFKENDLIIIGNERTGIPKQISSMCSASVVIPMGRPNYELPINKNPVAKEWGIYPNYSVATAADIVSFYAINSLHGFESFDLDSLKNEDNHLKRTEAILIQDG